MHRATHGRLGVQGMVDRLATRELVKEHSVWVSVHLCNVLCVSCVCVCVILGGDLNCVLDSTLDRSSPTSNVLSQHDALTLFCKAVYLIRGDS